MEDLGEQIQKIRINELSLNGKDKITIFFQDWKTSEQRSYTLNHFVSGGDYERIVPAMCPLDHTPLVILHEDQSYRIICHNCSESYTGYTQSEINSEFKSKIEDYKRKVIELKEKEEDLSLRIQKAGQKAPSQSLSKCTVNCRSCKGITCEKSC